jgi:hypothetical protein
MDITAEMSKNFMAEKGSHKAALKQEILVVLKWNFRNIILV